MIICICIICSILTLLGILLLASNETKHVNPYQYTDFTYAYHTKNERSVKPVNYPTKPRIKSSVLVGEHLTYNLLKL